MTSVICGKSARGRVLFIGGMAHCTIAIAAPEMPDYIGIPKKPSWAELNRGKKSKRQRRG